MLCQRIAASEFYCCSRFWPIEQSVVYPSRIFSGIVSDTRGFLRVGHETPGPALRGGIVGCGKEIGVRAEAIEVLTGCVDHEEGEMYFDFADVVLVQVIESNLADALPLVTEYLEYGRFNVVAGIEDAISGRRGVKTVNPEFGPVKGIRIFA